MGPTSLGRVRWNAIALTTAVAAIGWAGCATTADAPPEPPARPPNVVLVLIDDLGWADLPAYGHRFHETPNIDRLVAEGIRFTDAYAAAPVCSPTRASIQSGQYPARVGITDFIPGHWRPHERLTVPTNRTQFLPLEVETVAESLKREGYATAYYGKWHLGNPRVEPDDQGYDAGFYHLGGRHFDVGPRLVPTQDVAPDESLTEVITEHALAFMEAEKDRPFFVMMSHYAVHIPLQAREALVDKYERKDRPASGVNHPVYAAMIEEVDRSVGRVLDGLDELGLTDDTLVVFFSDNGGLSERFDRADGVVVTTNAPLRDEKGTLYEGGIREPLIVRWPGVVAPGTTSDAIVSSVDLFPTFVDVANGAPPAGQALDGISLVPVLRGAEPDGERAIYFHYPHYHHSVPAGAVRRGDLKLIEFFDDGRTELYDLRADLGETRDLSSERPADAAELRTLLADWREWVGASMPVPNPDFDELRRAEWGRHPSRR